MWVNGRMNITSSGRESILGDLIQIKYEGKTIQLLDHIGEYYHVLRKAGFSKQNSSH